MPQAFRSPPRQMGFKPKVRRLVPTAGPVETSGAETASERSCIAQLQQLYTRKENLSLQLEQVQSTVLINRLQGQIQPIQVEIQGVEETLSALRRKVRLASLQKLASLPPSEIDELASHFSHLAALYKRQAPLLKQQRPVLQAWFDSIDAILLALQQREVSSESLDLAEAKFQRLLLELHESEPTHLQGIWRQYQSVWQAFVISEPVIETLPEADEETLTLPAVEADPRPRFELSIQAAEMRQPMGLPATPPSKSYQEYLDLGFTAIDTSLASRFQNRRPLSEAVAHFLGAMGLDKARYEAYFGLGYLYSLVQDLRHAFYFLDLAYQISQDASIAAMIAELKQTAGPISPAVKFS